MSGNMIQRLGREWFNQRVAGGHFLHNGRVLRVIQARGGDVECHDINTEDHVMLPHLLFTGFKVFQYPSLGYRKFGPGLAVWITKKHSYNRGLRERCLMHDYSPVTNALLADYGREMEKVFKPAKKLLSLVFLPEYDTIKDLKKLFDGKVPCVVLNENVLIEANVLNAKAEGWIVYFRRQKCATIDLEQKIHWFNDAYKEALASVFKDM